MPFCGMEGCIGVLDQRLLGVGFSQCGNSD